MTHLRSVRHLHRMSLPQPTIRAAGYNKRDVWSLVNETAAEAEKELGRPMVNLGQGFYSYPPPDFALDAAAEALRTPMLNQYSPTRGRPELLSAVAEAYSPLLGQKLDPKTNVLITPGANMGLFSASAAFLQEGDEGIVFAPFFDHYLNEIKLNGAKVVVQPMIPPEDAANKIVSANDWYIDFDALERAINPRTKVIIVNTPQNPVGKLFSREELEKIGNLAIKHNLLILSDEVYDRLHFDSFTRTASLSDEIFNRTLTVGSAGKMFAATGWRIGWLIGPPHLIAPTAAVNTKIPFCTNSVFQNASAKTLNWASNNSYFEDTIEKFKHKFALFTKVFDELKLPYSQPAGGYFLLVNFSKVKIPESFQIPDELKDRPRDFHLCNWLIREFGVVSVPPTEFSTPEYYHFYDDYLRFAVCKDDSVLEEAALRLRGLSKFIEH